MKHQTCLHLKTTRIKGLWTSKGNKKVKRESHFSMKSLSTSYSVRIGLHDPQKQYGVKLK